MNRDLSRRFLFKWLFILVFSFTIAYNTADHLFRLFYRSLPVQVILLGVLSAILGSFFYFLIFHFLPFLLFPHKRDEQKKQILSFLQRKSVFHILIIFWIVSLFASILVTLQPYPIPIFWKDISIPTNDIQPSYHGTYSYSVDMENNTPGLLDGSFVMAKLYEDELLLGPSNSVHADIGNLGGGHFSFWKDHILYFSSSGHDDPRVNGKQYRLSIPIGVNNRWIIFLWILSGMFTILILCEILIQYLQDKNIGWKSIILNKRAVIYLYLPVLIFIVFSISITHPIVYGFTFCLYFPTITILEKITGYQKAVWIAILSILLITISRMSPISMQYRSLDTKDLNNLAAYKVPGGSTIQQDYYLPAHDWRLDKLHKDDDVKAVLRVVGDIDENTMVTINDCNIGTVSDLMLSKGETPLYGLNGAYDYFLNIPKDIFLDREIPQIKLKSSNDYLLAYSNGISPLPEVPHVELITTDGETHDLSQDFAHRRFRFSMIVYLISPDNTISGDPVILGSIQ